MALNAEKVENNQKEIKKPVIYDKDNWEDYLNEAQKRTQNKYKMSETDRGEEGQTQKQEDIEKDVRNSVLEFVNSHKKELEEAYGLYKYNYNAEYLNKPKYDPYSSIPEKDALLLLQQCKILLLTANKVEKKVLHNSIIKNNPKRIIIRAMFDDIVCYIFKWQKYFVAHVAQSQTGGNKDYGTNYALKKILNYFTPNVIFSIGVAFGIDHKYQNIGEVIVSRRVLSYSDNKRKEDTIVPDRSQDKKIDNWLDVRLTNLDDFMYLVNYGDVLSGGSVVSSIEEKDRICLGYTKNEFIVGGEMEGNALFQVASIENIPCAVVKGICDWGVLKNGLFNEDGDETKEPDRKEEKEEEKEEINYSDKKQKEEETKDQLQAYAMTKVIAAMDCLLQDKHLFSTPKENRIAEIIKKVKKYKTSFLITLSILLVLLTRVIYYHGFYRMLRVENSYDVFTLLMVLVFIIVLIFVLFDWKSRYLKNKIKRCLKKHDLLDKNKCENSSTSSD